MNSLAVRLRALAYLLVLAAVALGLRALAHAGRQEFRVTALSGEGGRRIIVAVREPGGAAWPPWPEVRVVASSLPVELDARRSMLAFPGGERRVVPPGWTAVLVRGPGDLEPLPLELDAEEGRVLAAGQFQTARRALVAAEPVLREVLGG